MQGDGVAEVQRGINHRRGEHAAGGTQAGQDNVASVGQLTFEVFPLQLQADQQEKNRHETVIDP